MRNWRGINQRLYMLRAVALRKNNLNPMGVH
jgi:hypothetical protein